MAALAPEPVYSHPAAVSANPTLPQHICNAVATLSAVICPSSSCRC
uniref:Uncharacterized protein n=1 Tax=Anguilla anguilla TaxID=7936 RepID=A0A0E9RPL1_ANGAN